MATEKDQQAMLDLVSNGCSCGGIGGVGRHLEGCRWHRHDESDEPVVSGRAA